MYDSFIRDLPPACRRRTLTPLDDPQRNDLLEIIEDHYRKHPTVITDQCPIKNWHPIIG